MTADEAIAASWRRVITKWRVEKAIAAAATDSEADAPPAPTQRALPAGAPPDPFLQERARRPQYQPNKNRRMQ
jgi:hypothetical protein